MLFIVCFYLTGTSMSCQVSFPSCHNNVTLKSDIMKQKQTFKKGHSENKMKKLTDIQMLSWKTMKS